MTRDFKGKPYNTGHDAGYGGQPVSDNPYPEREYNHGRWLEGHRDGVGYEIQNQRELVREQEERDRTAAEDAPWLHAKECVSDESVFSEDQINCLHNMIDELREALS